MYNNIKRCVPSIRFTECTRSLKGTVITNVANCKLFYLNYLPLDSDFPLRVIQKVATGQSNEIVEQVEDYGQVTYYSEDAMPVIKNVKGKRIDASLLPRLLPGNWADVLPPTLGFHMHETLEITLLLKGRMLYMVDGQYFELRPGDVMCFGSYIPHSWLIDRSEEVRLTEITLKTDFFDKFRLYSPPGGHSAVGISKAAAGAARSAVDAMRMTADSLKYLYLPFGTAGAGAYGASGSSYTPSADIGRGNTVAERVSRIHREMTAKDYGYRFAVTLEMNLILLEIMRRLGTLPEKTDGSMSQVIRSAREYITAHLSENPSLNDIAQAAYVTPHHLSYLFKKQVGIGIADYMNQQKILRTAELLSDSSLSILDIALQSGFTSKSNFYRVFKEYYGVTPQQMRDALTERKLAEQ